MLKKLFHIFILFLVMIEASLIFISFFIDFDAHETEKESHFLEVDPAWADTLLKKMNLDQKIGQLFFIELTNAKLDQQKDIDSLVKLHSIGGMVFRQTDVVHQILLTNYIQSRSKIPLLIGSEGSTINNETMSFPFGQIVNSTQDSIFRELYIARFSELLKLQDINIDFSNSLNTMDTCGLYAGFSDQLSHVISTSESLRKNLYKKGIISCINYQDELFFNNNSSYVDSVSKEMDYLGIRHFFAIKQNPQIVNAILANESKRNFIDFYSSNHNFKGLVFCNLPDTISIEGMARLFHSGSDVLIIKSNITNYISGFKELVTNKLISETEINQRVRKLLLAKKWAALDKTGFKSAEQSLHKIFTHENKLMSWNIYKKTTCLIKNQGNLLPISNLIAGGTHILTISDGEFKSLHTFLNLYTDAGISNYTTANNLQKQLSQFRNIVVAIDKEIKPKEDSLLLQNLMQLGKSKKMIVVNFGFPQNLYHLKFAHSLIQNPNRHEFSEQIAAQILTGSMEAEGKLVPAFKTFSSKAIYRNLNRLQYTIPEAAGFNSQKLSLIDSLINQSIQLRATPGCQILAAKNGKVFYYKSFGYHTYSNNQSVKNSDIYDIASISKVAATTMVAMKLYEQGAYKMDDSIKYYLDDTIHCTIKNHQFRDFFVHQTGLPPDMPILPYIRYRKPGMDRYGNYYAPRKDTAYSLEVAENFFFKKEYLDSIVESLFILEIDSTKPYLYSDINFNILYSLMLKMIQGNYTDFLKQNFFNPLHLRTLGFQPLKRFNESRIVPTQDDKFWRKQLLRGYPHDESAAIYGGIAGNAGIFSNANDLAILFQMLLNGGNYGGKKILNKETVEYFTSVQENSSRGLGFSRRKGYFGHTGFTGCVVWANPETGILFVFLSNSIHPKPTNRKLKQMQIRNQVLNLILSAYKPITLEQFDLEE